MTLDGLEASPATKRELRAIKKYFTPFPRSVWLMWLTAAILIAIGISDTEGTSIESDLENGNYIGLAGVAGGFLLVVGLLRVLPMIGRPGGTQMDRWLDRDLARLGRRAVTKCGLGTETLTSEPVLLAGPVFDVAGADFAFRALRRDITRFTPVAVTILNFTEHEIFAYQGALDRLTGNVLEETTDEYFYRDVVSVSTRTESQVVDKHALTRAGRRRLRAQIRAGRLQIPRAEEFILTTSGGTSISVTIEVVLDKLNDLVMGPGGLVQVSTADRAIAAMRKMLREKKMPETSNPASDPTEGL